ncbi:hypothetical protein KKA47_07400 [bacterium]|nr:hypothetical protein [bacterium]
MEFQGVRPNIVRYEMRSVGGENPHIKEQKKPGAFGRFLSGMGRFVGAVAMPISIMFPPAAIGAAGMYGISQVGDQVQMKTHEKMMEQNMKVRTETMTFPGLDLQGSPQAAPVQGPASGDYIMSSLDSQMVDVLVARTFCMQESAQMV